MAHMYKVVQECIRPGCTKRGEYHVRNSCNAPCGVFCRKHAGDRVAELNREEERMHAKRGT